MIVLRLFEMWVRCVRCLKIIEDGNKDITDTYCDECFNSKL